MTKAEGGPKSTPDQPAATPPPLSMFDMSGQSKLSFAGPQALWFLDQLVTNKVDELALGWGAEALLLSPNGRITSHLRILNCPTSTRGPEVLMDASPGHAQQLLDFFGMRVFATKVTISDVSGEFGILRVMGEAAVDVAGELFGIEAPGPQEHQTSYFSGEAIEGLAARLLMPTPGLDLWISEGSRAQAIGRLTGAGVQPLSKQQYQSLRTIAGVAQFGADFDETYLPQEAALERAVHFSKGCYLGQEAVAMAQRGRIKRRLRHLEFRTAGGTGKVMHGEREVGRVTSAAQAGRRWFAIGTLRTDVPVGDSVQVVLATDAERPAGEGDGASAVVKELPGTTYGPRVPSARELREKLQRG